MRERARWLRVPFVVVLIASCGRGGGTHPGIRFEPEATGGLLGGLGGDLDNDDTVGPADRELVVGRLGDPAAAGTEADLDGDGVVGDGDLGLIDEIIAGRRPSILGLGFVESDPERGLPSYVEVRGVNFGPDTVIAIGDARAPASEREPGERLVVARLFVETTPADGSLVRVASGGQDSIPVRLRTEGIAIGTNDESSPDVLPDILADEAPVPANPATDATPCDCCIEWISFRGKVDKLKIYAYDDSGAPAGSNGRSLPRNGAPVPLRRRPGAAPCTVSIVIVEDGTPVATFKLDCRTLARGELREPQPEVQAGTTTVRPRVLLEIVDFEVKKPCEPQRASLPAGLRGGVRPRDDADWPRPEPHKGSGALAKFSVPAASIAAAGCRRACWSQLVSTSIERYDTRGQRWRTLFESDLHVDNPNADDGPRDEPWYCYEATFTEAEPPDGERLVLGDGPHIRHGSPIRVGGRSIDLGRGDVIRRRSVFVTQLVCYQDAPARVLAAFLWSLTTLYTHDPDNAGEGGTTTVVDPTVIGPLGVPGDADRRKLRAYLEQQQRDRARAR